MVLRSILKIGKYYIKQVDETTSFAEDKKWNWFEIKRAMNSKRQGKEPIGPPRKRGYVTWNSRMDAILTSTLFEQINERNKGDGDFKSQAYQAVANKLRAELGISVTIDHVKNRIKVWKKHYATITEI
ncbi:hypothetical protein RDABS01_020796 [Bienertia sinuspersici]